jgi:homopolymeric O-antigen transport system permease protein
MASVTSNPSATSPLAARPSGSLTLRIEPPTTWFELRLHDLRKYRELLFFLELRDVKVRQKQTAIGVAWVTLPIARACCRSLLEMRVLIPLDRRSIPVTRRNLPGV